MRYVFSFVSIFNIGCALQEPATTTIGSIVKSSADAVSGIAGDGGLKEYMGITFVAPPADVESSIGTIFDLVILSDQ